MRKDVVQSMITNQKYLNFRAKKYQSCLFKNLWILTRKFNKFELKWDYKYKVAPKIVKKVREIGVLDLLTLFFTSTCQSLHHSCHLSRIWWMMSESTLKICFFFTFTDSSNGWKSTSFWWNQRHSKAQRIPLICFVVVQDFYKRK